MPFLNGNPIYEISLIISAQISSTREGFRSKRNLYTRLILNKLLVY